jgi:tagatose-1,6-bisphosphate aldolase
MHLPALYSPAQTFSLLELDRVVNLASQLGITLHEKMNRPVVEQLLYFISQHLLPHASGLVLEPDYGLPLLSHYTSNKGVILTLDAASSDEVDPLQMPQLIQNWGVVAVKNNYSVAKVTLYYHPEEETALQEKQLIAELYDHCRHEGIDLVLKLMLYTKADQEFSIPAFQESQLTAVSEFRTSCTMMALQYPQDALGCATLTTELDIPWVVVGDGQDYEGFKEIVRDSMEGGAQGFWAGDCFWHEIKQMRRDDMAPDMVAIEQFIKTTARDRVIELARIADEFGIPA